MQRLDRIRQAALWQSLFRFDKGKITTEVAIRSSVGIVIPLILGAVFSNPSAGAVGALGALNVASSDSRDPYKTRGRRMLVASLLVGAAVCIGSLSAWSGITSFLAVTLWAFAAGMMVVLGTRAGDLGVTTLVTLVVFAARPMPLKLALQSGLVAACGGVLQAILSVAVWPFGRYRPERRFISSLYATLSHLAISPAGPDAAPPGDDQIAQTRDALSSLAQDHTPEAERYVFLLSQAERVRLSLLTLRRLHRRIAREPEGGAAAEDIDKILAGASDSLQSVSVNALKGRAGVESRDLTEAARIFRKHHATVVRACPERNTSGRLRTDRLAHGPDSIGLQINGGNDSARGDGALAAAFHGLASAYSGESLIRVKRVSPCNTACGMRWRRRRSGPPVQSGTELLAAHDDSSRAAARF